MTAITSPEQTRRQDPRRRIRAVGALLTTTSIVQTALGVGLLAAPVYTAHLLAGIDASEELAKVLRIAGLAALAMGAWCMLGRLSEDGIPHSRPLDLVPGLVVYNGCAVAITAHALIRGVQAPLLWLGWTLHSVLLVWSVACLALERDARQ